jgi:hypothetical protein
MSVVSSSRRWALLLLVPLGSLTIAGLMGCGGEKEVDPYVYASLRGVIDGDTLSNNFLFEIDTPRFDYVRGNTGIARDGNLLEFIVGTNLENQYRSYSGALLGVQKFFTPTQYLMVKRIMRAGVVQPVDSCTSFVMPKVRHANAVDLETPGANLGELNWQRPSRIKDFMPQEEGGEEIAVQSGIENFIYAPRHDLPDSVQANPGPADMGWYAIFPDATFQIVEVTPGADYMLHLLKDKDLPLVGSFTLTSVVERLVDRRRTYGKDDELGHIVGTLKINWFRYANSFVEGHAGVF